MSRKQIAMARFTAAELENGQVSKSDLREIRMSPIGEALTALRADQDPAEVLKNLEFLVRQLDLPFTIDRIVTAPHKPFPFQELPPEMRNMIYGLILTRPKPISICTYRVPGTPKSQHAKVVTGPRFCKSHKHLDGQRQHKFREFDFTIGKWKDNPENVANILLTCKQMYSEAAAVLYGTNEFVFPKQYEVKCFIATLTIQPELQIAYKCLTVVDLGSPSLEGLKQSLKHLKVAINLRTVYLDAGFQGPGWSREDKEKGTARLWCSKDVNDQALAFSRTVIGFLSAMKVASKAAGAPLQALDIIRFRDFPVVDINAYRDSPRFRVASASSAAYNARYKAARKEDLRKAIELRASRVASQDHFSTRIRQLVGAKL
ncbi:unnamed protein product [Zymoseptoria tritici ST99CH_3D1]|nr:unnamed protein product [Zymoseptoria tritici ST99CH_3D1]